MIAAQQLHNVQVHDLAAAWRQHVAESGHVDPAIELLAVPVLTTGHRVAWRPALRIPATEALVVVHTARPHESVAEAIHCLQLLLTTMAAQGCITLQGRAAA